MKPFLFLLILLLVFPLSVSAQINSNAIEFQLVLYDEVMEYLDGVFLKFADGYMEADEALRKITFMRLEYDKRAVPYPVETEKLFSLTKELLHQIEKYFIYFKRSNREDPLINIRIARIKFDLAGEEAGLKARYP